MFDKQNYPDFVKILRFRFHVLLTNNYRYYVVKKLYYVGLTILRIKSFEKINKYEL